MRAAIPASDPPQDECTDAALEERVKQAEAESNESAYRFVVTVDGTLGGESTVVASLVLTPDGVATPPEDIWADPVVIGAFECGTNEVVHARVRTVERVTATLKLHKAEISRRLRVGTRGFLGEPAAVGMLLDARCHMARLALSPRTPGPARIEHAGGTARVVMDFVSTEAGAMLIELFSEPSPNEALTSALAEWIDAQT